MIVMKDDCGGWLLKEIYGEDNDDDVLHNDADRIHTDHNDD